MRGSVESRRGLHREGDDLGGSRGLDDVLERAAISEVSAGAFRFTGRPASTIFTSTMSMPTDLVESWRNTPTPARTARFPLFCNVRSGVIAEIQRAAATGIYDIRGGGAKRNRPISTIWFLGFISRYPLEGYREKCATNVLFGTRFTRRPSAEDP